MKLYYLVLGLSIGILCWSSCEQHTPSSNMIQVNWMIDSIQLSPRRTHVTTTITNNNVVALDKSNWSIDYNHMGGRVDFPSMPSEISIINVAGDYFKLRPTDSFTTLPTGASRTYSYAITGTLDKMSEVPVGMFMVINGVPQAVELLIKGVDDKVLSPIGATTAATRYLENQRLSVLPKDALLPIIPRPSSYQYLNEKKVIGKIVRISASEGLENEVRNLSNGLAQLGIEVNQSEGDADILLAIEKSSDPASEAYTLRIDQSAINITASTQSGIFYGVQSLIQYLGYAQLENASEQLSIQGIDISDKPRFDYRGMHLDVSRNFHSKQKVEQLLDLMSLFKLNKFHFHITDDEGWRLEIPGLPELTEIGSKRGYTPDEKDHLMPSYGSGHDAETAYGSGHYTRAEFIEILKYANDRHIEVITEIDVPAHARAAIKSMQVRYDRYMAKGNEDSALEYRLDDPDDLSEYGSAQNWHDNVVCVCQESTYKFMDKVFGELVGMYREAQAPLTTLHVGGDEMPYGAWHKSPICQAFIEAQPSLASTDDLPAYFFNRMNEITSKYNLITGGWEDMTLVHSKDGHGATDINMAMLSQNIQPYVWNAIIGGGRDDMIYRLANAGFPVVMSNSSSFYFDMAYDRDPDEIGLSWSGYADTEKAFNTEPLDLFFGNPVDGSGQPLTYNYLESREELTAAGLKNFLGIQAQLWSETIRNASQIDYMVFPKLFGFAERAWAAPGAWTNKDNSDDIKKAYDHEWNVFANTIGQKTMPLIDSWQKDLKYRIPEPGAKIDNGKLIANTSFPGLKVRYSIGENGKVQDYLGPIEVENPELVKIWSTTASGRTSRRTGVK